MHRLTAGVTVVAAACVHIPVSTDPRALGAAAPELRAHGVAEVAALEHPEAAAPEHTTARVRLDDMVETRFADRAFDPDILPPDLALSATTKVRVRDLLAGCPDGTIIVDEDARQHYPDCQLLHSRKYIELGRRTRDDPGAIIASAGLVGVGGLVACTFECSGGWRYASGAALVGIGVAVVGVGVWLYAALAKSD